MIRICPACCTRYAQLVAPDCVICAGSGIIRLGAGALALYEPDVVSLAAGIALESAARAADQSMNLTADRRKPVRATVNTLVDAGIIARPTPTKPRPPRVRPQNRTTGGRFATETTPSELARSCVQTSILDLDAVLITAAPYRYQPSDRPNARGLPLLSANGHPSHLARIADPETPGNDTCTTIQKRTTDAGVAKLLIAAAPEAAAIRRQRKRKAA